MDIARSVVGRGFDAETVANEIASNLRGENLRLVVTFVDWRIDTAVFARTLQRLLPAPVVGCTTIGVIANSTDPEPPSAAAIGFYGDWLRVGIGIATELPKSALARSRDAVHAAAHALDTTAEVLTSARHVGFTLVDGSCGHEEAFCIASAATAPQIRMVGGSAATEVGAPRRALVFANGETLSDAGIVVLLETTRAFEAITSQHMTPTALKTVVTAASGRALEELDGRPAADRLRELGAELGVTIDPNTPSEFAFARFVDGVPYLRSITGFQDSRVLLACAVEPGHVLRLMRPGDLIGQTQRDLAATAERIGGRIDALLAFSCIGRHWEAAARGIAAPLAQAYATYPTVGFQSFGEQTGMLLVNHTLTGLAIGGSSRDD